MSPGAERRAMEAEAFIRAHTVVVSPPLAPEIKLYLATEITPIWQATEEALRQRNLPPPFWAFCWPGGQALARYVLDKPATVRGLRVLDFAAGGGVGAIAAALAGAAEALAADVDEYAAAATALNGRLNGVSPVVTTENLVGGPNRGWDVVMAGDVCYEQPMSDHVMAWLRRLAGGGALVLIGDPGRSYLPGTGLESLAEYDVPTSTELEDRDSLRTRVLRVVTGLSP